MSRSQLALVVRRTVKASPSRVFDAWTEPDQLRQWWGPRPVTCCGAEVDLRAGGSYRIGNRLPDGSVLWIYGAFEVVERPRLLVYSWRVDAVVGAAHDDSRVTVRFEARGRETEVIVVHERIDSEPTKVEHEKGWLGCLDGLAGLFEAPGS